MKKVYKSLVITLVVSMLYVVSYGFWRGAAYIEQCDHPYQVDLPNNVATDFYYPLIAVDRYLNEFNTEINITSSAL